MGGQPRSWLAWVPGTRDSAPGLRLIRQIHDRTAGRRDLLITRDAPAPSATEIEAVYGVEPPQPKRPEPGLRPRRNASSPGTVPRHGLQGERKKGRGVEVVRAPISGTILVLEADLERSPVRTTISRSFVARHHGTDRYRNSRKRRQT